MSLQYAKESIVVSALKQLISQDRLDAKRVHVWIDYACISQDDAARKQQGVGSLLKYASLSDYMLVPCEQLVLEGNAKRHPEDIPTYGERGVRPPPAMEPRARHAPGRARRRAKGAHAPR